MTDTEIFGRGLGFPLRLGPDGRVAFSDGPESIRESIRVILLTEPGERRMLPEFGGGLGRFLFQPNVAATHRLIEEQVTRSLSRWEPRIRLEAVTVERHPGDGREAVVTVRYRQVATGETDQLSLSVRLTP